MPRYVSSGFSFMHFVSRTTMEVTVPLKFCCFFFFPYAASRIVYFPLTFYVPAMLLRTAWCSPEEIQWLYWNAYCGSLEFIILGIELYFSQEHTLKETGVLLNKWEGLWNLNPWRYSDVDWMISWVTWTKLATLSLNCIPSRGPFSDWSVFLRWIRGSRTVPCRTF